MPNLVVHPKVFWIKRFAKGEFFRMPEDQKIDESSFILVFKNNFTGLVLQNRGSASFKFIWIFFLHRKVSGQNKFQFKFVKK